MAELAAELDANPLVPPPRVCAEQSARHGAQQSAPGEARLGGDYREAPQGGHYYDAHCYPASPRWPHRTNDPAPQHSHQQSALPSPPLLPPPPPPLPLPLPPSAIPRALHEELRSASSRPFRAAIEHPDPGGGRPAPQLVAPPDPFRLGVGGDFGPAPGPASAYLPPQPQRPSQHLPQLLPPQFLPPQHLPPQHQHLPLAPLGDATPSPADIPAFGLPPEAGAGPGAGGAGASTPFLPSSSPRILPTSVASSPSSTVAWPLQQPFQQQLLHGAAIYPFAPFAASSGGSFGFPEPAADATRQFGPALATSAIPVASTSNTAFPVASSSCQSSHLFAMDGLPIKRPADDDFDASSSSAPRPKQPRPEPEYSREVKSRYASHSRTGQACDRCRVRKIKCDPIAGGCAQCRNQNLDCFVTDRVTHQTRKRGYADDLEREKNAMVTRIHDLERLLATRGVEVRTEAPPQSHQYDLAGAYGGDPASHDNWTRFNSLYVKSTAGINSVLRPFPRAYADSRPADSFLGLSADSAPLSSIKGTKFSILGTTLDITSFDAPDVDEPSADGSPPRPLYNKSMQSFLQSTMNINPRMSGVTLPPQAECITYSEWYFLMVSPFLPVLHKPSYLKLLNRMYDDKASAPSVPEIVIVHMVLATIYYQYGIRNPEDAEQSDNLNQLSNKHYHFALSYFFDLAASRSIEAVQAMAMIAAHSRSFPKPSCGLLVIDFAFGRALELNLHRTSKKPGEPTDLDNEMRKRIWWTILTISVTLHGRLGKPMPITLDEFDVDFPEALPDECLTEEGVDETLRGAPVTYQVGLAGFKVVPLFIDMYTNLYSVRRDPSNYVNVINVLEERLRQWKSELPDSLRSNEPGQPSLAEREARVYALYTALYHLEFRLCLRHPSVAMTTNKALMAENTRICEETAQEMLKTVSSLMRLKSLDTTWYQIAVYVAAIFSTLVAHWERRFEATQADIVALRSDMNTWLTILRETASFLAHLGSGPHISNDIGIIIERTIAWIERDMGRKDPGSDTPSVTYNGVGHPSSNIAGAVASHDTQTSYPSMTYQDATTSGAVGEAPSYDNNSRPMYYTGPAGPQQPSGPDVAGSIANPLITFASQASQATPQPLAATMWQPPSGPSQNSYRAWAAAIADSPDRFSADALLTLGGAARDPVAAAAAAIGVAAASEDRASTQDNSNWPLLLFNSNLPASEP